MGTISDVIRLMDEHPLEWEFAMRGNHDKHRLVTHKATNIELKLHYAYYSSDHPYKVTFHHRGMPDLGFIEHWRLMRAVKRLKRQKLNQAAVNYLEEKNSSLKALGLKAGICPYCKEEAYKWCWVCDKCQAVVHRECYSEIDKCPSCGVSLRR